MAYNANSQTVDSVTYTRRVQFNGTGSTTNRAVKFDVAGPGTVSVVAISGNSSNDRAMILHDGTNQVGSVTVIGTPADTYTYTYKGGAGSLYLYSGNSGINIYAIKLEYSGESGGDDGDDDESDVVVPFTWTFDADCGLAEAGWSIYATTADARTTVSEYKNGMVIDPTGFNVSTAGNGIRWMANQATWTSDLTGVLQGAGGSASGWGKFIKIVGVKGPFKVTVHYTTATADRQAIVYVPATATEATA
jgi:hypothetical protein